MPVNPVCLQGDTRGNGAELGEDPGKHREA